MKFIRNISRGGFGVVDEVEDEKGNRWARKTFQPRHDLPVGTNVDKLRKRFLREVKVQSRLPAELFVPVIGSDLTGPSPWYTMPLATSNFKTRIEGDKKGATYCKDALAAILNALEFIHKLGIVHRDLKPENVLEIDGKWLVGDLGLVLVSGGATSTLSSKDSAWGSPLYAAPEQATGFHNVTNAADIYSFGCILHDIFGAAARIPFAQCTAPGPVGPIIWKCTETKAHRRLRDIASLRGALLMVLATPSATAPLPTVVEWAKQVASVATWDDDTCSRFARAVATRDDNRSFAPVFMALDEDTLSAILSKCPETWAAVADGYCDWAQSSGFDWEFCDVVIGRLERIFSLGDMTQKSFAAMAAAELGRSHNRWYVMRRVMDMCGPTMDENVAQRLAIEIVASDAQLNFRRCAEVISRPVSDFHPVLASIINARP